MVFGGALAFGWWQLRSLERDRRETQRQREHEQEATGSDRGSDAPSGAASDPTVTGGQPGAVSASSRPGPSPD